MGIAVVAVLPMAAADAQTGAGTEIVNVARLSYSSGGQQATIASNENRIVVAERLDVAMTAGPTATLADGRIAVAAVLSNQGNGREAFAIAAVASAGNERVLAIAIDSDGDGRYDPARDTILQDRRTPVLTADQRATVFAILDAGTTGTVILTATAVTGSGPPGTTFAAGGDGGGDAFTGPTGASASLTLTVEAGPGAGTAPTLAKSAVVSAPDGTARATRGATITYTIVARFPAATQDARFADPIPAGTSYAPNSLTLDDAPLSDANDGDAGALQGDRISITLGEQVAGALRTIRFKVIIQ